jgi:hypothetical protein
MTPVTSTIESAAITQVNSSPTRTGTGHRGLSRSISSQISSNGTAVPVWSGDRSTIPVALS